MSKRLSIVDSFVAYEIHFCSWASCDFSAPRVLLTVGHELALLHHLDHINEIRRTP